jgi:hypothetical protein
MRIDEACEFYAELRAYLVPDLDVYLRAVVYAALLVQTLSSDVARAANAEPPAEPADDPAPPQTTPQTTAPSPKACKRPSQQTA